MKKTSFLIIIFFIFSNISFSQFKVGEKESPAGYNKSSNNLILGFINPKNFTMNHSFNVSMMNTRYGNVSLTSYVNSMNYRFSDKLNISADIQMQYSPFASSSLGAAYTSQLQKDLSGISLASASLNYKISKYASINFQYINNTNNNYLNNFYSPFGYNNGFNSFQNSDWR
ncbi:MAG: hypothetical protein LH629_04635 [Ignavibacteria bacterium]|nr:hypothetical protein [Ignavibacteria bacterium]